jgi:precorrin-8X/cobalt-precorrin-8 methylmutase
MPTRLQPCFAPDEIEARSFAIIDAEAGDPKPFTGRLWHVARRLVHTCADFDILPDLVLDDAGVDAGIAAIRAGASIFTDTEMARCGMVARRFAPFGCTVESLISLPGVAERARSTGSTRSAAAVALAGERLGGAIVAIGNAPTAVLALLDHLDKGGPAPALVVGMPVGFVNAAESKELLLERCPVPHIALRGRKGGSTLAAATVNALAILAAE